MNKKKKKQKNSVCLIQRDCRKIIYSNSKYIKRDVGPSANEQRHGIRQQLVGQGHP
jgi:hypothetical protein